MKKIEWLMVLLLMGMGVMCMTLSAVSFRSDTLFQFGGYVKKFILCGFVIAVSIVLLLKWLRSGRKSKE
ncbi:hypothetical protein [Paenibacillus sp. sgz500958]|uniref:hypothetical protein n=1 Tax=Paenibacillus sp. sgz500958 TaxID=3242475 RepID=UPI0036D2A469